MNDDINKYTVQLTKHENIISIFILNEHKSIVDYCRAKLDLHLNKYYIFEPFAKFVKFKTIEILLHHDIIERASQELHSKFILTNATLISLL